MYSINVVENGKDIKLVFTNKHEKDTYVANEAKYCKREHDTYICTVSNIEQAKKDYLKKRMLFAKLSGFKPKDKNSWVRNNDPTDLITA